ncbi:MAG: polymer-forming cytoskeletal protein [Acidobacteriota bacterium]
MGWFDNDEVSSKPNVSSQKVPQRPAARTPRPSPVSEAGSTLGRQVHVDGTIVCGEDLTILGKVEGTIRADGTLVIAKEADVRATIDGQRILVHGKVDGNVHGAERVVLGATAALTGDIEAPALEITEGAYFKGNVEMRPQTPVKSATAGPKSARVSTPAAVAQSVEAADQKSADKIKKAAGGGKTGAAASRVTAAGAGDAGAGKAATS